MNKRATGRPLARAAAAGAALLAGYLLCRHVLLELHGMREWPRNLLLLGLVALAAAAVLDARRVMLCIPVGYLGGFAAGMLLRTEGVDPGGGARSNGWLIWTGFFLAAMVLGTVLEVVHRRKRP